MSNILEGVPEAMTYEKEQALAERIGKENREDDLVYLVMCNMREALPYARYCCRSRLSESEVFSLCYAALMKAAPRFRPGGIRFFAYAKPDVRGELSRHWKSLDVVHNSSQHRDDLPEVRRKITYGRAAGVGVDESEGLEIEEDIEPLEPDYVEPEFERVEMNERWAAVEPLLMSMHERERIILRLYYETGFTFDQIASMLVPRKSRQWICHTHDIAMAKLKELVRTKTKLAK